MRRISLRLIGAIVLMVTFVAGASATETVTLYDNMTLPFLPDRGAGPDTSDQLIAQPFLTGDYDNVSAVVIDLNGRRGSATGNLSVEIWDDDGSGIPGRLVGVVGVLDMASLSSQWTHYTFDDPVTGLTPHSSYFVLLSFSAGSPLVEVATYESALGSMGANLLLAVFGSDSTWRPMNYYFTGNFFSYMQMTVMSAVATVVDFNGDQKVDFNDFAIFAQSAYDDGELDTGALARLAEHWLEDYRLTGHWKLDEEGGGIAVDSAGDNDGTLHGDPNWQPTGGKVGGAIELDGIDDYVSTDFVLDPADGPFSVFAWIKAGVPEQVVISQVGPTGRSWLAADSEGNLMTDLRAPAGRLFGPPLISNSVITDGEWRRIALVWDGSYRHLYTDGEEVATDIDDQKALVGADGGLYFGAEKALGTTGFFDGMIDDIRLYDQVVSP